MRFPALRPTVSLLLLLGANACGNEYPDQPADPDPVPVVVPVTAIHVLPLTIQFGSVGETRQLAWQLAPANATDKAIVWESSDSSVATVDAAGLVTAKAPGVAVFITAFSHDGHHQASVNVSVVP